MSIASTANMFDWGDPGHTHRPLEVSAGSVPVLTAGVVAAIATVAAACFAGGVASDTVESFVDEGVGPVDIGPLGADSRALIDLRRARHIAANA